MVRLTALLAVWYISSLVTSLSTKEILRVFPYPMTLSAVQQFIAAVMGWASLRGAGVSRLSILRDRRLHQATLPVATVMVIALASYRWALMMATVSFVHTVKTLGPVFTIAFSRLLLGERLPASRYASVVPVVLGVALTSVTEAEFALSGLLAILLSTAGQALQAVVAKRLLRERDVAKGEVRDRDEPPPSAVPRAPLGAFAECRAACMPPARRRRIASSHARVQCCVRTPGGHHPCG